MGLIQKCLFSNNKSLQTMITIEFLRKLMHTLLWFYTTWLNSLFHIWLNTEIFLSLIVMATEYWVCIFYFQYRWISFNLHDSQDIVSNPIWENRRRVLHVRTVVIVIVLLIRFTLQSQVEQQQQQWDIFIYILWDICRTLNDWLTDKDDAKRIWNNISICT